MSSTKTRPTAQDVIEYIDSLPSERRQKEGKYLAQLFGEISGLEPSMWGPSIIGFGHTYYQYESGHRGEAPLIGFSPRNQRLVLYVLNNFDGQDDLLQNLGKYRSGKICLYLNKLEDVNLDVLEEIVRNSFQKSLDESSSSGPCGHRQGA